MVFRGLAFLLMALVLSWANPVRAAAERGKTIDIEAGPVWSDEHAGERCPEAAEQWTADNPGFKAEWTGNWVTTVPGEMSVCICEISGDGAENGKRETVEPVPVPVPVEPDGMDVPGADLRSRRGYWHAWINEAENVSVLYFLFDNGVLRFYRDEASMGYVFDLDLSGIPERADLADEVSFADTDGDGYGDVIIPLPDGSFAVWRWNQEEGTFEATAASALLPAPAATRITLDALPAWTRPHLIVHVGEPAEAAARLGHSWLLDFALDIRPERREILEWLRSFPVESASLVKGLSRDDAESFQGAIRFAEDKRDILAGLEGLSPSSGDDVDRAEWELLAKMVRLFGIPDSLLAKQDIHLDGEFVEERPGLFKFSAYASGRGEVIPETFAMVADAGGEKLLLVASSPEGIDQAKNAVNGAAARLEIVRRVPGRANFLQFVDDAAGSETEDIADDMHFTPKAAAAVELALGLREGGVDISLYHNLFDVALGDRPRPEGSWRAGDNGFGFGGGSPWLAGAFSLALTERDFADFIAVTSGRDGDEVREMMARSGIDLAALAKALRSVGLVVGGNAVMHDREVPHPDAPVREKRLPGGYAFVSGDAGKMRQFAPLVKMLLAGRIGNAFRETGREGWDFFFELTEEYVERGSGMPFFTGMKDGVFILGILDKNRLEDAPEIEWGEGGGDGALLRGRLDLSRMISNWNDFFAAVPLRKMHEAADAFDLEKFFTPEGWSAAFRTFAALQEVEAIRVDMPDWNRLDVTVHTGPVDYENVWDLVRTSRMMTVED